MKFRSKSRLPLSSHSRPPHAMGRKVRIKSAHDVAIMRRAGLIVGEALQRLQAMVVPGATTADLDAEAVAILKSYGAKASFLGYGGFPASICASVNDQVVHGIPNRKKFQPGDIIGIDMGAYLDGFHADAALTVPVLPCPQATLDLLSVTEASLMQGIAQARVGNHVGDISHAIQSYVERLGYSVVEELVGHGVGHDLHEDPQVPNFGSPGDGPRLRAGMTLAIEPMINQGTAEVQVLPDKWTVVTLDGRLSAHFEHTIVITNGDPEVLTLPPPKETNHTHTTP